MRFKWKKIVFVRKKNGIKGFAFSVYCSAFSILQHKFESHSWLIALLLHRIWCFSTCFMIILMAETCYWLCLPHPFSYRLSIGRSRWWSGKNTECKMECIQVRGYAGFWNCHCYRICSSLCTYNQQLLNQDRHSSFLCCICCPIRSV